MAADTRLLHQSSYEVELGSYDKRALEMDLVLALVR